MRTNLLWLVVILAVAPAIGHETSEDLGTKSVGEQLNVVGSLPPGGVADSGRVRDSGGFAWTQANFLKYNSLVRKNDNIGKHVALFDGKWHYPGGKAATELLDWKHTAHTEIVNRDWKPKMDAGKAEIYFHPNKWDRLVPIEGSNDEFVSQRGINCSIAYIDSIQDYDTENGEEKPGIVDLAGIQWTVDKTTMDKGFFERSVGPQAKWHAKSPGYCKIKAIIPDKSSTTGDGVSGNNEQHWDDDPQESHAVITSTCGGYVAGLQLIKTIDSETQQPIQTICENSHYFDSIAGRKKSTHEVSLQYNKKNGKKSDQEDVVTTIGVRLTPWAYPPEAYDECIKEISAKVSLSANLMAEGLVGDTDWIDSSPWEDTGSLSISFGVNYKLFNAGIAWNFAKNPDQCGLAAAYWYYKNLSDRIKIGNDRIPQPLNPISQEPGDGAIVSKGKDELGDYIYDILFHPVLIREFSRLFDANERMTQKSSSISFVNRNDEANVEYGVAAVAAVYNDDSRVQVSAQAFANISKVKIEIDNIVVKENHNDVSNH